MIQMTVGDFKAQFSQVLDSVLQGEEVEILYGRAKKPVACLSPIQQVKPPRKIGTLEGIASFTEVGDGKISMEEFLGITDSSVGSEK